MLQAEEFVAALKKELIHSNVAVQKCAVNYIKEYLEQEKDPSFVRLILQNDVHIFLNKLLISQNHIMGLDVLSCNEYICSYDIVYRFKQGLHIVDYIVKSIFLQIKKPDSKKFLIKSLRTLSLIFNRLESYPVTEVSVPLKMICKILENQNDKEIIIETIEFLHSALSGKMVFNTKSNLDNIYNTWEISVEVLIKNLTSSQDSTKYFVYLCKCCQDILLIFNKSSEAGKSIHTEKIKTQTLNYIDNFALYLSNIEVTYTYLNIYTIYMEYLTVVFESKLDKFTFYKISLNLIKRNTFYLITKVLNLNIKDVVTSKNARIQCHFLISEIIARILDVTDHSNSMSYEDYKAIMNELYWLPDDIQVWTEYLEETDCQLSTKNAIIIFCCFFYIYSQNLSMLKPNCITHIVKFIIKNKENLPDITLKYLWLLFAVFYVNTPNANNEQYFGEAVKKIQHLVCNTSDLTKVLSFDKNILEWACRAPHIRKKLVLELFSQWINKANDDSKIFTLLLDSVKKHSTAQTILLHIVGTGTEECSLRSAYILKSVFSEMCILSNVDFVTHLQKLCIKFMLEASNRNVIVERVYHSARLLFFGTRYASTISPDNMSYIVQSFCELFDSDGYYQGYRNGFYVNILKFAYSLFSISLEKGFTEVFDILLKSKHTPGVLMLAVFCGNKHVSCEARKILNVLLDFIMKYKIKCHIDVSLESENIVKLLFQYQDEEILVLNIEILNKLLIICKDNLIRNLEFRKELIKGMHFLSMLIYTNPMVPGIHSVIFKYYHSLLIYSKCDENLHKNITLKSSHFVVIEIENELNRPFQVEFFEYINTLLSSVMEYENLIRDPYLTYNLFWKDTCKHINQLLQRNQSLLKNLHTHLYYSIKNKLLKLQNLLEDMKAIQSV